MNNLDTFNNTNPLIKDSFLGSKFLNPQFLFDQISDVFNFIFRNETLGVFYIVISVLTIIFIIIIVYTTIRMFEIRKKERIHLHHEIEEFAHNRALKEKNLEEKGEFKNERWKKVLDFLFSENSNDWKLAVIEADLMLFDLLTQMGFKGESLGDKLKSADRDSFPGLSFAWEVHNIRNKIAHEGSSFEFSLHEAKRVISLYEQIFQEFGYI